MENSGKEKHMIDGSIIMFLQLAMCMLITTKTVTMISYLELILIGLAP